jgi:quinol monooxygenase YgiN
MITITGSILAKPETFDELLALSLEHTHRSRGEPGCRLHSVHIDAENPMRLVFLEQWDDQKSVLTHFAVPASREFVSQAGKLAASQPEISIYRSDEVSLADFTSGRS